MQEMRESLVFVRKAHTAAHKFCFAESTGSCLDEWRSQKVPLNTEPLKSISFCPKWIVPTPQQAQK